MMIGKSSCPHWFARSGLLSQFGSSQYAAQRQFIQFVEDGRLDDDLWSNVRQQMYLGDEQSVERMVRYCEAEADMSEYVKAQYSRKPNSIEWYEKQSETRNEALIQAFQSGGYTQRDIAVYFDLHYSSVSRILKKGMESVR